MKLFNQKTDQINAKKLTKTKKKVDYTSSMISRYQESSMNAIYDFNDVIEETKEFKMYQLENLTKLEENTPNPLKSSKVGLQYYQEMEPYELQCR